MTFAGYQGMPASFAAGLRLARAAPGAALSAHPARGAQGRAWGSTRSRPIRRPSRATSATRTSCPEHGTQYVVGAEGERLPGTLTVEIDVFWKNLRDLVVPGQHPGDPPLVNDGIGRAYGGEVLIRQNLAQAPLRLAGLHAVAQRAEGPSGSETGTPFEFDQTNILTVDAQLLPAARVRGGRRAIAT